MYWRRRSTDSSPPLNSFPLTHRTSHPLPPLVKEKNGDAPRPLGDLATWLLGDLFFLFFFFFTFCSYVKFPFLFSFFLLFFNLYFFLFSSTYFPFPLFLHSLFFVSFFFFAFKFLSFCLSFCLSVLIWVHLKKKSIDNFFTRKSFVKFFLFIL